MVNGYYYASFDSVEIDCYDPPSGANVQGSKSYVYTDDSMSNSSIEITDKNTILGSFFFWRLASILAKAMPLLAAVAQLSHRM